MEKIFNEKAIPEEQGKNPEEKNTGIFEKLGKLEENKKSKDPHKEWTENFKDNQAEFSSKANLEKLAKMSSHERVFMLARTGMFITYTPEMAGKHFEKFPEDLEMVKTMFRAHNGLPADSFEYHLFTIAAPFMDEEKFSKFQRRLKDYKEIAERRNIAPSILLDGFECKYNDNFKKFGEGANGLLKALDEAGELMRSGDHFINPEQIFTPEYEKLEEKDKAELLRKAIAEIQFSLVFDEVFNSVFTREHIEERKKHNIGKENSFFDVGHSMIYKTYQPAASYETAQKTFDYYMGHTADWGGDLEEYPFHRLLIAVLDRIKDIDAEKDLNTDTLVDFWNKNRNPIFANAVTEALIKQGADRAGGKLLKLLRSEKIDKNSLTAILHRIEFGKIGISKQGVKYLERMYDLGELNNPDYFVQRLTAKGDVGIFDDEKILQKYFNLGDLESEEKVARPRIHDFVYQTLFFEKEGETKEERQKREQYLKEFKENYFDFYENEFFQKTGVRFNNLDFKEQGWFLNFYKNADESKKESLMEFAKKHKEAGLRTFLSLEKGEEMGDKILELGNNLDIISASLIFNKYAEIVDLSEKNAKDLSEFFKKSRDFSSEEMRIIARNSIKKGSDLLNSFFEKTKKSKGKNLGTEEIMEDLENYKNNLIFTATVYTSLKEAFKKGLDEKDIKLEDLKGITFEQVSAEQIKEKPEDKKQMLRIYSKNYEYKPELQEILLRAFEEKIESGGENIVLYLYKKDGEIIAFNRFDKERGGRKYFGSCNVSPGIAGSSIGSALIEASLKNETLNNEIIEAECLLETEISSHYIDKCGFVVKKVFDNYKGTGEKVFGIERNATFNSYYRNFSQKEIIKELEEKFPKNNYKEGSKRMILKFGKNSPELIKTAEELINKKGYLITRYFFRGKDVICAFEKNPAK